MLDDAKAVQATLRNCCGTTADDVCHTRARMNDLTKRLKGLAGLLPVCEPTFTHKNRTYNFRSAVGAIEPFAIDAYNWMESTNQESFAIDMTGNALLPGAIGAELLRTLLSEEMVAYKFTMQLQGSTLLLSRVGKN